jgi:hypothetical protein
VGTKRAGFRIFRIFEGIFESFWKYILMIQNSYLRKILAGAEVAEVADGNLGSG